MFRERRWLLTLALLLPNWMAPVAVWIIKRETRRAEEFLANPVTEQSGFFGSVAYGLLGSHAKKAAKAQHDAYTAQLTLQRSLLARAQMEQYGDGLLNRY